MPEIKNSCNVKTRSLDCYISYFVCSLHYINFLADIDGASSCFFEECFYRNFSFGMQENGSFGLSGRPSVDSEKSGSNDIHRFELLRSELMELEKRVQISTTESEIEEVISMIPVLLYIRFLYGNIYQLHLQLIVFIRLHLVIQIRLLPQFCFSRMHVFLGCLPTDSL